VSLAFSLTDVRRASDLTDYAGELEGLFNLRITDKNNGDAQSQQPATLPDLPFSFTIPCAETLDPLTGAICSTSTSADAITPGIVPEGLRSNWQLGQVQVLDGGADDDADTPDNSLFAVQGVFAP